MISDDSLKSSVELLLIEPDHHSYEYTSTFDTVRQAVIHCIRLHCFIHSTFIHSNIPHTKYSGLNTDDEPLFHAGLLCILRL